MGILCKKKTENKIIFPSILDREIENKANDRFGHIHFAEILYSLIKNNNAPFSIGLLGKWGVGKSSIKKLCRNEFLLKDNSKYKIIDFNAWRYESKDIRTSLLKEIYLALEGKEENFLTKSFKEVSKTFEKTLKLNEALKNLLINYRLNIIVLFVHFILSLIMLWLLNSVLLNINLSSFTGVMLFGLIYAITYYFLKNPYEYTSSTFPRYFKETVKELPIKHSIEYEYLIKEQLKEFNDKNPNTKIVIFVDDLDRLTAEEMITGLDAIRVFQEMADSKFIFVISCYDEHIANSIIQTQKPFGDIVNARKYLDRVFQFRIEIPTLPNVSMIDFAKNKLVNLSIYEELENDIKKSSYYKLDNLLDILVPIEVNSPRTVIQILNTFLQGWWIAKQREQKCDECAKNINNSSCINNDNCLLIKNVITERLDILAVISVAKILFPDFYQQLTVDSRLLKAMLHSYFGVQTCKVVYNRNLEMMVKNYATIVDENGKKQTIGRIADKYNDLQSYLASIQGINIPENLRPFIMLLQDSLEMEIGSDSIPLYDSLITQNRDRLIDLLGIKNIQEFSISGVQTNQLYKAFKLIMTNESKEHLGKACVVLEPLCLGFTGEQAKYLTEVLIHQLLEHEYISKLEYSNIIKLFSCSDISNENFNNLYTYLLKHIDNSIFQSQDISKYPIIEIVNLGFYLKYNNILNDSNIEQLDKIQNLELYDFNSEYLKGKIDFYTNKIELYGNNLLYDLGFTYIYAIIKFSNYQNIDNDSIYFENIEKILNKMLENLATTRDFAEIISQGLVSNCENVVKFFINYIKNNNIFEKINTGFILEILDSYNQRVIKGFQSKDSLNENLDNYVNDLIDFFETNKKYLINNSISLPNTKILLNKLKDINKVKQIDKIFTIYNDIDKNLINNLVEEWSNEIFTQNDEPDETELLSKELIKLLSEKYIENNEITSLRTILENTFEDETIEIVQINLDNYLTFISNLSDKAIKNKVIIEHIGKMYNRLNIALTNKDDESVCEEYFNNIFEILLPVFKLIKNKNLDTLLANIYENHLDIVSDRTEYFYKKFENNWLPEDKENLPNYDLIKIIKSVKNIFQNCFDKNKESVNLKVLYNSIYTIYSEGLVNCSNENKTLIVHCLFWLWKFDISFAYNNMQEFLDCIVFSFNYYVLALRNSTRQPNLLKQLWESLFKIDTNVNIEKHTKNFLLKDIYKTNTFYKTWMTLIKEKDSNIFYNALEQSLNSNKDKAIIIKNREKLTKTILNIFNDEKFTEQCGKLIFSYYIGNNDGTQKNSIALWIRDLLGIDAKEIINHNTCRKISNIEVERLNKIFTANTYLTNKMKKLDKNKRQKRKRK